MPSERRAKVFRRTGPQTIAVQLMDEEGNKFLPGIVEVECAGCLPLSEELATAAEVRIVLGAYDAWKRRFARCEVSLAAARSSTGEAGLRADVPRSVRQRPFRWCVVSCRKKSRRKNKEDV
jgi:hypothetical protein